MANIIIGAVGGLILIYLDTIRRQLEDIQAEQDHQNKAIRELLEHIAGAAEAVKEGRQRR